MKRKFLPRKKYRNPFLPKRSQDEILLKKKKERIIILFVLAVVAGGLIYLFIYSPLVQIKKIVVSGTQEPDLINELTIITNSELAGYRYFILPKNNILLLDKSKLKEKIEAGLVLDTLIIEKGWLHTLKIEAAEKVPVLLWQDGDDYYYVDKQGVMMGAVAFEEINRDLPLVSRGTSTVVVLNEKLIEGENIDFIRGVLAKVSNKFKDWNIYRTVAKKIKNDEIYFYTSQGWYFVLSTDTEIDKYLDYLDKLLAQKIKDTSKLEYVDLRIEDKIFYKERE